MEALIIIQAIIALAVAVGGSYITITGKDIEL